MDFADGSVYQGEFIDSIKNNQGTLRNKNGDIYTGQFMNGEAHGFGTVIKANKIVLSGRFEAGNLVAQTSSES